MQDFDKQELEEKLKEELILIAKQRGVAKYRDLAKPALVASILQKQQRATEEDKAAPPKKQSRHINYFYVTASVVSLLAGILYFANYIGLTPDKILLFNQTKEAPQLLPLTLDRMLDEIDVVDRYGLTDVQIEDQFEKLINPND